MGCLSLENVKANVNGGTLKECVMFSSSARSILTRGGRCLKTKDLLEKLSSGCARNKIWMTGFSPSYKVKIEFLPPQIRVETVSWMVPDVFQGQFVQLNLCLVCQKTLGAERHR